MSLPVHLSSFIGREAEASEVRRLLGTTRLLTLTGPGGIGKTRLALVVAGVLDSTFASGAALVDLACVADPAAVVQAVASTLGVHERPSRPVREIVADVLREERLLLVLDNCEHVIQACAELAEFLLRSCPGLQMLATSREALRIPGETSWRVPALGRSDAMRLFLARAAAAAPGFEVTDDNAMAVARLCQQLDSLPLAIELAAARLSALGLDQLAALLRDRFRLLVRGSRTAAPRQQTLRATVEWSYELLDAPERRAFERLAVFAGGWTLEAAIDTLSGDGIQPEDVPDLLARLADKSLVEVRRAIAGGTRYKLLETLRQFGWECLTADGSLDTWQRRHVLYLVKVAEGLEEPLKGPEQRTWLARVEEDHENLRAALQWTLDRQEVELGLRLAAALWRFWWVRGHQSEGRRWLDRLLSSPFSAPEASDAVRAKALSVTGALAYDQGDFTRATESLEASLALYRRIGDERGLAWAMSRLGLVVRSPGDVERARALLEESLVLYRRLGDRGGAGWATHSLARVAFDENDYGQGLALLEEALALLRSVGDTRGIAWVLHSLAFVPREQGEYHRATELYSESLSLFRELGDDAGTAWASSRLGLIAEDQGDGMRAKALLEESLALYRKLGDQRGVAWSLLQLGQTAIEGGDCPRAARVLNESLSLYRDQGDKRGTAWAIHALGLLARAEGHPGRARSLFQQSLALFREQRDKRGIAWALTSLGAVAASRGEMAQAAARSVKAVSIFHDLGDQRGTALALEQVADVCSEYEQPERAARLLAAAHAIREAIGAPRPTLEQSSHERAVARTRDQLGEAGFAAMWTWGLTITPDQAVAEALEAPMGIAPGPEVAYDALRPQHYPPPRTGKQDDGRL